MRIMLKIIEASFVLAFFVPPLDSQLSGVGYWIFCTGKICLVRFYGELMTSGQLVPRLGGDRMATSFIITEKR